jgi:hypothetical protein
MNEDAFQQAAAEGKIATVEQNQAAESAAPPSFNPEDFLPMLEILRRPARTYTVAPTTRPKSLADSIKFFDDGADQRLYLYVAGTWRFVALT